MITSCSSWKVVTYFGKEHVNWSGFGGVIIGRIWKIKLGKLKIGGIRTIIDLIVQLFPIISPIILNRFTCSLPKNVTTFHRKQNGIIHFCLSPNKRVVQALWIYTFTKKIINSSKLNFSTSFKLPKIPFYWDWDKNEWFHLVAREK